MSHETINDFCSELSALCKKIQSLSNESFTEEATKHAFIMPFLRCLGYDVFNPREVLPEMVCDVIGKQGEKIDYAILDADAKTPVMLVECKSNRQQLDCCVGQLSRYFAVSQAKVGILTNGIEYRFYTTIDRQNIMDMTPFYKVNLTEISDDDIERLSKFRKGYFDASTIVERARGFRNCNIVLQTLKSELRNPSKEFVKVITDKAGMRFVMPREQERYRDIIRSWMKDNLVVGESVTTKDAENCQEQTQDISPEQQEFICQFVKAVTEIVSGVISKERISVKEAKYYTRIYIDDKVTNGICLLLKEHWRKPKFIIRANGKDNLYRFSNIDEVQGFRDVLIESASRYINK